MGRETLQDHGVRTGVSDFAAAKASDRMHVPLRGWRKLLAESL
jgi:hypothetical protein